MMYQVDDVRIAKIEQLLPPIAVLEKYPITPRGTTTVAMAREAVHRMLHGDDDRLLVIVGPCSIHDPHAALEYAQRLMSLRQAYADSLEIIMRVYFEKPRTTVGWKGLINDPFLNQSYSLNDGLRVSRKLLLDINNLGMPAGAEFLDMISPQYIADLISWGAIGARTTESQVHRELASGLSCPVGFKNGTDGNIKIAIDAVFSAGSPHHFLSVTKFGHSAIVTTSGNPDCHVILRGGKEPNYDAKSIAGVEQKLRDAGLPLKIMIDCSHANSCKQYKRQINVVEDLCTQIDAGNHSIFAVMIESHLVAGRQDLNDPKDLVYGQSITDACIGWEDTERVLAQLAQTSARRMGKIKKS